MLHTLKATPGSRNHRTKRVGRGFGSGIGGRSTRGTKGQLARKSGNVRLGFEGGQTPLYMRVGKIGFNNHNFAKAVQVITIKQLNYYPDVKVFDLATLVSLKLVHKKAKQIKVIGNDLVNHAYTLHVHTCSNGAKLAIAQAGGKIEFLN